MTTAFHIPDRVDMGEGPGGLPRVELRHADGARATVFLHGAHVAAWRDSGGHERLFMSRKAVFRDGQPIRGGIPVVFPQFGRGPLPMHGLVRTRAWRAIRSGVGSHGEVTASFGIEDDDATRVLWPHRFRLELTVTLADALTVALAVENPGPTPFEFQSSLHTYLRVDDIACAGVRGLRGTAVRDFVGGQTSVEARDPLCIEGETDRLYSGAPDRVTVEECAADRALVIEKTGQPDIVVWNPWVEKARRLEDLGDDEYRFMVCVETGCIQAPAALAPGARWTGCTRFTPVCQSPA